MTEKNASSVSSNTQATKFAKHTPVPVEGRIVNSNMGGFSSFPGNLFTILVYYFEVRDVSFGMIVGHTEFVNCIGDMTAVFFDSILKTSAGLAYVAKNTILSGQYCL